MVTTIHGWDQWAKQYTPATITNACCTAEWIAVLNEMIRNANLKEVIADSDNKKVIAFAGNDVLVGLMNIQDNRISLRRDTNTIKDALDRNGLRLFAETTEVPVVLVYKGYTFYFIESQHMTAYHPNKIRFEFDVLNKVLTRDEIERINVFNPDPKYMKKVGGLFRIYSTQNPELLQSEGCGLVS